MDWLAWLKVKQVPPEHQASTVQHVDVATIGVNFKTFGEPSRLFPMEAEQFLFDRPSASHILGHFDTAERAIGLESVAVMESISKHFALEQVLNAFQPGNGLVAQVTEQTISKSTAIQRGRYTVIPCETPYGRCCRHPALD